MSQMSKEEQDDAKKEAKFMQHLAHPNIIAFHETFFKRNKKTLCIVMEYIDGGDLDGLIEKQKKAMKARGEDGYFTVDKVLNMFTQVALGLKHLHDRKILHRDIKSANIFMTKKGMLKLGDLGMCTLLNSTVARAKTFVGTPYYMAPEIIRGKRYSFEADIWSLGILTYEMCALCYPYDSPSGTRRELNKNILAASYDPIPEQFRQAFEIMISMMLQQEPRDRPTINQILKHPLVKPVAKGLLNEAVWKDEFSHTVLHK